MDKPDDLLSKYAESHASLIKQATRTWTTLAVLSIYCLAVYISDHPHATLPLVDATLQGNCFAIIALGLLAALLTHWQEALNRANHLRQGRVQARIEAFKQSETADAREAWDAMVYPSTQAVWAIASAFARSPNCILRWIAMPYFVFLKVMSFLVHVGLPCAALVALSCIYLKEHRFHAVDFLPGIFVLTIIFQLAGAIVTECRYSSRTVKEMRKRIESTTRKEAEKLLQTKAEDNA